MHRYRKKHWTELSGFQFEQNEKLAAECQFEFDIGKCIKKCGKEGYVISKLRVK